MQLQHPRVKDIIKQYMDGNLQLVYDYLNQPNMIVDSSTWAGNIKNLIEEKNYHTAKSLIELVAYKFYNF